MTTPDVETIRAIKGDPWLPTGSVDGKFAAFRETTLLDALRWVLEHMLPDCRLCHDERAMVASEQTEHSDECKQIAALRDAAGVSDDDAG